VSRLLSELRFIITPSDWKMSFGLLGLWISSMVYSSLLRVIR